MSDRYAPLRENLVAAVLDGPGSLDAATRRDAFAGRGATPAVERYVAAVQDNAYKVHDELVDAIRAAGLDDGGIFETTASAAIGRATEQLEAALAALDATADPRG